MTVSEVVKNLSKYPADLKVYARKSELFGNVAYVFHTSMVKHPILGTACVVLRDDDPYVCEEEYYEDSEERKEVLGECDGCQNYDFCKGCEWCEHKAHRVETEIGQGGCSSAVSNYTVGELIEDLKQYDGDTDVMSKPYKGVWNKNFFELSRIELKSYSFFGNDIPCVMLSAI